MTISVNLRNYCFTQGFNEFPKISRDFRGIPKFVMLLFYDFTKLYICATACFGLVHMLSRSVLKPAEGIVP